MKVPLCPLVLLLVVPSCILAGEDPPPPAATLPDPSRADASPRRTIEHGGEIFALASESRRGSIETAEYLPVGETLEQWTQMVTVQRLTFVTRRTPEDFLQSFRAHVCQDGASLDVLKQGGNAAVFAVRLPASESNDEQVVIGIVFAEASAPTLLNVVQYAMKPTRRPVPLVAAQLQAWRDAFVRQAIAATGS
ncbi:hypothetical protein [Opitutus sp. ER46]|uniref:hypothetical protein n=1 Tax=Opitutus sp. ER46 TaxID=2161864 RepID=UPI000D318DDB|nr:hypothetical protein [Opitutus sp. ER46]PTX91346.1 hypothetical protein DB354_15730 [Opitutus sp. ER46]